MNHKDLLKVAIVLTLSASAATAFAAGATISGSTVINGNSFSPSTNVTIYAASALANYSLKGYHINGSRTFWSGSNDSRVYYQTKAPGSTAANDVNATDTVAPGSGWSSL